MKLVYGNDQRFLKSMMKLVYGKGQRFCKVCDEIRL